MPTTTRRRWQFWATPTVTATAAAGMAVIVADIVAFMVDLARGGDGMPYA